VETMDEVLQIALQPSQVQEAVAAATETVSPGTEEGPVPLAH
jgi:hypothetical protein